MEFAIIPRDLLIKLQLEHIAAKEGRSVAQITDAFIQAGLEAYCGWPLDYPKCASIYCLN